MEKKNIALFYGGNSLEWEVSVRSGKNVATYIDKERYNLYEILLRGRDWSICDPTKAEAVPVCAVDKNDFSCVINGKKILFDAAVIMIHGNPGENGLLQAYLEMMNVPCTTCSSFVSAVTFDKYSCKQFLRDQDVLMAKDVFIRKGNKIDAENIVEMVGLPCFVKPTDGGSSFGVTKVKRIEDLMPAIEFAFTQTDSVLIEEYISGPELAAGVFRKDGEIITLPLTEIISHNEFFDYDAKYLGKSDEICPAPVSKEIVEKVNRMTTTIYEQFGCENIIRVDYILHGDDAYFLEINSVPGFTAASLVPAQLKAAGMDPKDVFTYMIESVLSK